MSSLFVAWRPATPDDAGWRPVGRLEHDGDLYRFCYTNGARKPGFRPFSQMERLDQVFESEELFPLFANRLLSQSRPEYEAYLRWSGFDPDHAPDPIVVLGVTEGIRQTDAIEVFPCRWIGNRFDIEAAQPSPHVNQLGDRANLEAPTKSRVEIGPTSAPPAANDSGSSSIANDAPDLVRPRQSRRESEPPRAVPETRGAALFNDADDYAMGQRLFESGDYSGAVKAFTLSINNNDKVKFAYCNRGLARLKLNDFQSAIEDFARAADKDNDFGNAWLYLGYAHANSPNPDYSAALVAYNAAVSLLPNDWRSYKYRGMLQVKRGDYNDAISDLNSALRLNPDDDGDTQRRLWAANHYLGRSK